MTTGPGLDPRFLSRPLAHRGLHDPWYGRPENSAAAIKAAADLGYGIEIDVQPSADGEAMVFHDYDLRRMTGSQGSTRSWPAAHLRGLRLLRSDQTIPTLPEILELVAGRAPLLIEIKDTSHNVGPTDGVLESAVVRALYAYPGPVAVMSFNPESVAHVHHLAPEIARGLTTFGWGLRDVPTLSAARRAHLRRIVDFDRVGASFVSHHWRDLKRERLAELRERDFPVLCWTIRSRDEEARARQLADNITFERYLPQVA